MQELKECIDSRTDGKAMGPDRIPFELFKCLREENLAWILNLFNYWWQGGQVGDSFKVGKISLIPKLFEAYEAADFRPITLLNTMWKLYSAMVN